MFDLGATGRAVAVCVIGFVVQVVVLFVLVSAIGGGAALLGGGHAGTVAP